MYMWKKQFLAFHVLQPVTWSARLSIPIPCLVPNWYDGHSSSDTYSQLMLDAQIAITLVRFSSKIIFKFAMLHFNAHNRWKDCHCSYQLF